MAFQYNRGVMVVGVNTTTPQYHVMKELLEGSESAGMELVERRRGGAKWFGIAHAYATNNRIIIVRIYPLRLRTSIKIIKYRDIVEVKVEHGLFFCKVHFALQGENQDMRDDDGKKWFLGLRYNEVVSCIKYINRMGGLKSGNA